MRSAGRTPVPVRTPAAPPPGGARDWRGPARRSTCGAGSGTRAGATASGCLTRIDPLMLRYTADGVTGRKGMARERHAQGV